jgi:hypothetical protein
MSRIGKKPVPIASGAKVSIEGRNIKIEGPKGSLAYEHRPEVAVALSDDGSTLAVSAQLESSSATGVGGDQASNGASGSGAVYVFTRDGRRVHRSHQDKLKGIKRLDRNLAVLAQLVMFSEYLTGDSKPASRQSPYLAFGGLQTVSLAAGIPDVGAGEGTPRRTATPDL